MAIAASRLRRREKMEPFLTTDKRLFRIGTTMAALTIDYSQTVARRPVQKASFSASSRGIDDSAVATL